MYRQTLCQIAQSLTGQSFLALLIPVDAKFEDEQTNDSGTNKKSNEDANITLIIGLQSIYIYIYIYYII